MDQDRQIRFAIPPFFLLASLLWGAYLADWELPPIFKPENTKELLGLLAATAVAIVPLGYLISTISVAVLKSIAKIAKTPTYEAVLSDKTFDRVWGQIKIQDTLAQNKKLTLYAVVTFDHEFLQAGIHTWLLRRWNSFNVAAHSIVALVLAHLVAILFLIPQGIPWIASTLVLIGFLYLAARSAWLETMKMIEFQSHRQQNDVTVTNHAPKRQDVVT